MSFDTGRIFEKAYHQARLDLFKKEEEQQWENMRHEKEMVCLNERETIDDMKYELSEQELTR